MDWFQDVSILSWNIRGALGRSTRRHIRDLVSTHHPTLCCIYETHCPFHHVEQLWTSLGYTFLFCQEARGYSGDIWVLSNSSALSFSLIDSMFQAITFSISKGNKSWFVSAVYASPLFSVRCDFWQHLKNLRTRILGPWLLLGDLNEVIHSSEVSGGSFSNSRALLMASMMEDCNFIEPLFDRGPFYMEEKYPEWCSCQETSG